MGDTTASTLIIGLGNPILSDDAVGWRVAQVCRATLMSISNNPLTASVEITEACVGGLSLAELMLGFHRVIVIDAVMTKGGMPGTVYHFKMSDLPGTLNTASAHDTNLITALEALRRFGADVPDNDAIDIVGVEAQDVLTFSEQCTPAVENNIAAAARTVMQLLK